MTIKIKQNDLDSKYKQMKKMILHPGFLMKVYQDLHTHIIMIYNH